MIDTALRRALGAAWVAGSVGLPLALAHAEESWRYLDVTVTADPMKAQGPHAWDGTSAGFILGPMLVGGLSSPLDLALCVVTLQGGSECYYKERNGKPESYCYDSLDCRWTARVPEGSDFGLVAYDLDTLIDPRFSDLVDAVIVSATGNSQTSELQASVSALIEEISVTGFDLGGGRKLTFALGEERRRARDLPVFGLDDCASPCRLQQSTLQIIPAPIP
jgi:hypothetical protein